MIDCHTCGHPLGSLMHVLGCEESPDRPELWAPLDDVADRGTMCDMTLDCNQLADEAYDLADLIISNQAKRVTVLEKLHAFGAAFRALADTGPVPSAPARYTDPVTSHKAAKQEVDLRRFSAKSQCAKLLRIVALTPATAQEATIALLGLETPVSKFEGCRRRMSDLLAAGYIAPSGEYRKNRSSNDESIVWEATREGHTALARIDRTGWSR